MAVVATKTGASVRQVLFLLPPAVHAAALAAVTAHIAFRGWRLVVLARGLGLRITPGTALLAQLAGDGAGAITPARAGSDAAKLVFLQRARIDAGGAAALLLGEGIGEVLSVLMIVAVLAALAPSHGHLLLGVLAYPVTIACTSSGALLLARLPGRRPPALWRALARGERGWRELRVASRRFVRRARGLTRLSPGVVTAVVGTSAAQGAARLMVLPILASGLAAGLALAPLLAWPLLLFYGGALLPAPAGGGVIELGFAAGLHGSLSPAVLAGLLIWWRVYTFYLGALAGGVVLIASARRPPATGPAPHADRP